MARFYGLVQGARGEATRMGSKGSGFEAWAQNCRSRVRTTIRARSIDDVDLFDVDLSASTQSYSPGSLRLLSNCDLDALLTALGDMDPTTVRQINSAVQSLQKAQDSAQKHKAKRERLAARARGKKVAA